jgi:hypothetical protein
MRENIIFHGKVIGEIDHSKHIYITPRTKIHQFRKFDFGFGLSEQVIDVLLEKNVEYIVVVFENVYYYWVRIWDFIFKAAKWSDNGDFQMILPLENWHEGIIPIVNEIQIPLSV